MAAADQPADRAVVLSALRARVARMERGAAADAGAAAAFCALILARATGSVVWISVTPDAWPPRLSTFGLDAADMVLVRAERSADALRAFARPTNSLACSFEQTVR